MQGVPSAELFNRDDLLESSPETLARVARTIISVVKVVESPAVDRSKVLSGQKKSSNASDSRSGPYGYGSTSRAASSVPNLSLAQLQRSASPTSPTSPVRKRWSPPSPVLATVRSVSPSERGSGTSSSKTAKSGHVKEGRITPIGDRPVDSPPPPTITARSPLRPRARPIDDGESVFTRARSPEQKSTSPSNGDHSVAESAARQSIASSATDTSVYSSLLDHRDHRNSNDAYNKYATIRTITTEATTPSPSEIPSYTRTEASSVAASLSDEMARKRGQEHVRRERRPSEALVVDLSRVAEERPEDIASRPGSKSGTIDTSRPRNTSSEVVQGSPDRVHLGKGKWPDDFLGVFQGQTRSRPIAIQPTGSNIERSPPRHSPISSSPPKKLAYVGASRLNDGLESPSQSPRRPTHRARHSVDTLAPKDSILRRDASPDSIIAANPRIMLRRQSTKSGAQRSGSYLPRSSLDDPRSSKEDVEPLVPFPRSVSGENSSPSPVALSDEPLGTDGSNHDKPRQPRGRFQSEIEGMSSRRRVRPNSNEELGNLPRRTRFESMVNLGVASSNASASDLLSRDSMDGSGVRQTLIVREEGKPPTHFVSH